METLLLLLAFPIIWPLIARVIFHTTITWKEMMLNVGIVCIAVALVWFGGRYAQMADVEIWNGAVTGKDQVWTSCEHSYRCNCRESCSGSGSNRTCTTTCDTCYEHSNDYDWEVYTTAGDFTIARVDRQGIFEPRRWTDVRKGEPASIEHMFANYIKAVPESLFNNSSEAIAGFEDQLPEYPRTYDYHRVDRIIPIGVEVRDAEAWDHELEMQLRALGPAKQVNVLVVLTRNPDRAYVNALEAHWLGGKKNDVVLVLGVPAYPKISWVSVMSWTEEEIFKVKLRDDVLDLGSVDPKRINDLIVQHVDKSFVRRPMADFEYLKDEIDPPFWVIIAACAIATLGSVALTVVFHRTDIG